MKKVRIRKALALFLAVVTLCIGSIGLFAACAEGPRSMFFAEGIRADYAYDSTADGYVITLNRDTAVSGAFDPAVWNTWGGTAKCLIVNDADEIPAGLCENWENLGYVCINSSDPNGCEIGASAFAGCPLSEVILGEGVTCVGKNAFAGSGAPESEYGTYLFAVVNPELEIYGFGSTTNSQTRGFTEAQKALGGDRQIRYYDIKFDKPIQVSFEYRTKYDICRKDSAAATANNISKATTASSKGSSSVSAIQAYCKQFGYELKTIDEALWNEKTCPAATPKRCSAGSTFSMLPTLGSTPKAGIIYWLLTHFFNLFH